MRINKTFFAVVAITLTLTTNTFSGNAQNDLSRPVTQIYELAIGGGSSYSSYLSTQQYSGRWYTLGGEWSKATHWNPEHMVLSFKTELEYANLNNSSYSYYASMQQFDFRFRWGLQWRKRISKEFQFTVGGELDINAGALSIGRNSNNPANAFGRIGLDVCASASWKTKIKQLPIVVRDQVSLPAMGVFFAPEYGEPYYEIWMGNRKGLAHAGSVANNFQIENQISVMLDFGRTAMEVGYRYQYQSYWANNINTHMQGHMFVVGIIPHGLGIKRKANINSSIY